MIRGILARARSLWRGLRHRSDVETEMQQEFRFHVEARVDDLVRAGLTHAEAARRARVEFGSFEHHKHEARASRGLRRFDDLWFSWLDLKLAFRMLRRYPGLTVIGGVAMAFGIAGGVVGFGITTQATHPHVPLDEGDRIVGLRHWHADEHRAEPPLLRDFVAWRDEIESIEQLGAFRTTGRNLIVGVRPETVQVAEISASGFAVARVPPLLGRWLNDSDEVVGAAPALVIGHDVWQSRFDGDRAVVGRLVRLGNEQTTIVGVMPKGFAFPVAHELWVPLQPEALAARDAEARLVVFGRLADGVAIESAEAELVTITERVAADFPQAQPLVQPQVVPFPRAIFDPDIDFLLGLAFFNSFLLMLIVLACANVGLLLFARAMTRELELAVKNALGASRARIVTQFFAEALVLAGIATIAGLGVARWVLRTFVAMPDENRPFWFSYTLSSTSVTYATALALLAALIAGVLPALMITGGNHRARLSLLTAGGTGTAKIGGLWTALIVVQVSLTVFFPATALNFHRWASPSPEVGLGFLGEEFLSARLVVDAGSSTSVDADVQPGRIYEEVARRLTAEPGVVGAAFSSRLPGTNHEQAWFEVAVEGAGTEPSPSRRASMAAVGRDWFDVLDSPLVSGRTFLAAEQQSGAGVAIVNQAFAEQVLGGRNPLGQSIRRAARGDRAAGPWYEVIGVAPNLGMLGNDGGPGVYFPLDPDAGSRYLVGRVRGDQGSFASRLRSIGIAVEPELQIYDIMPMAEVHDATYRETRYLSSVLTVISPIALVLSLMAIYSVVDFTVTKRTREIGVRVALGAAPRSILSATFRRPLIHIASGIIVGGLLILGTSSAMFGGLPTFAESSLLLGYVILMWAVCMLACVVPTRRALRVHPMDALRADS